MISIPSCEATSIPEEEKGFYSSMFASSSTNSTGGQGSSHILPKEGNHFNKIDWNTVEESLMAWFSQKKIINGNPEQFLDLEKDKQRKLISLRSSKNEGIPN